VFDSEKISENNGLTDFLLTFPLVFLLLVVAFTCKQNSHNLSLDFSWSQTTKLMVQKNSSLNHLPSRYSHFSWGQFWPVLVQTIEKNSSVSITLACYVWVSSLSCYVQVL
jgi:hypothetical protein